MKINGKRNKLNQNKKTNYTNLLAIILAIFGIVFLILGFNVKSKNNPKYSYQVEKDSSYEVVLLPNEFYAESTLPSNCYYASKSIDYFNINFKYDFKGSKQTDIEYIYGITADLVGTIDTGDGQKKEVWVRNCVLQENVENSTVDTDTFLIDKKVDIDYKKYNDLARSYEKNYGIVIETNLKVHFNISYLMDLSEYGLSKEKVDDNIELNIPITNTITNVNEDYQKKENKNYLSNSEQFDIKEIILYVFSGLSLFGFIFIVIMKNVLKNKSTPEEIYNDNIKRILKYHKDLIVTVSNEPKLNNLEVMNVPILEDLIDIAEQNQSNIIHYEIVKNEESILYVIVGNFAYMYKVSSDIIK